MQKKLCFKFERSFPPNFFSSRQDDLYIPFKNTFYCDIIKICIKTRICLPLPNHIVVDALKSFQHSCSGNHAFALSTKKGVRILLAVNQFIIYFIIIIYYIIFLHVFMYIYKREQNYNDLIALDAKRKLKSAYVTRCKGRSILSLLSTLPSPSRTWLDGYY